MITSETAEYLPEALIGYCTSQPYMHVTVFETGLI
jgi:hypothetical protein